MFIVSQFPLSCGTIRSPAVFLFCSLWNGIVCRATTFFLSNSCDSCANNHKDSGSMGSRDGVEEQDTVLMRGFYKTGTKMTLHFRVGIGVFGSRNGTLDSESCDYCKQTCLVKIPLSLLNICQSSIFPLISNSPNKPPSDTSECIFL